MTKWVCVHGSDTFVGQIQVYILVLLYVKLNKQYHVTIAMCTNVEIGLSPKKYTFTYNIDYTLNNQPENDTKQNNCAVYRS